MEQFIHLISTLEPWQQVITYIILFIVGLGIVRFILGMVLFFVVLVITLVSALLNAR